MYATKREFIAGSGAIAILAASGIGKLGSAAAQAKSPLTSDIGKLDKVLVHSVKAGSAFTTQFGRALIPDVDFAPEDAEAQHAALNALLRQSGAEVIEVTDALNAARAATLASGIWEAWIDAAFPRLGASPDDITAEVILGTDPDYLYRLDAAGNYDHIVDEIGSTMWTRDSAFMTPKGLVICNSSSTWRGRENMLLRFVYRYSPMLAGVDVALDAVEQGFIVEGGDAMMADANTMFLGVGNRTSPDAAPAIARALDIDVIAVQIGTPEFLRETYPGENRDRNQLGLLFLHLDTSFTLVGHKHALSLPYIFEMEHSKDSPLARYIRGAVRQSLLDEKEAEKSLKLLEGIGTLTLCKAGSGKAEKIEDMKLVDYCRSQGYRVTNTGGAIPDGDAAAFAHFMSVTYGEQRRQASNVVQALPGRVIAYEGNPATQAALEADGLAVDTFPGRELWNWHGGPHCLTQPLLRS
ncbi:arginine deiminase family protein [Altererythrobacter sp. MF3-039]|uniref:arginine deiminase family protein n=1 Tax=Altererythrobacter sp. MF3-039 TaxID=3252901 RepID=UPI00390C9CB9